MRDVFLICEGTHGQVDQRVLDLLVITEYGLQARIKPAGGSSSLGALATYLQEEATRGPAAMSKVKPEVFTIKDRDFSPLSQAESTWTDAANRKLMWRRHEIENYLVEPSVVHTWFENLRLDPPRKMDTHRLPVSLTEVEALISNLARSTLHHHVGRLIFGEMQQSHRVYTDTIQPLLPKRSGHVILDPNRFPTPTRADWLSALNVEWSRVQSNRRKTGRIPCWTARRIRERFDSLLTQFQHPSYFAAKTYLLDFEGKGLLWSLGNRIQQLTGLPISTDTLENELISVLSNAYQMYRPFQPDEFHDLAERMKQASP